MNNVIERNKEIGVLVELISAKKFFPSKTKWSHFFSTLMNFERL